MLFIPKKIKKFQQGGEMMPADQASAAPEEQMPEQEVSLLGGLQDPLLMLTEAAVQALQSQDCLMMAQVCQGLIGLVQQAMGGQGAPQEAQSEPVFAKRGAKLVRRIPKNR